MKLDIIEVCICVNPQKNPAVIFFMVNLHY